MTEKLLNVDFFQRVILLRRATSSRFEIIRVNNGDEVGSQFVLKKRNLCMLWQLLRRILSPKNVG